MSKLVGDLKGIGKFQVGLFTGARKEKAVCRTYRYYFAELKLIFLIFVVVGTGRDFRDPNATGNAILRPAG